MNFTEKLKRLSAGKNKSQLARDAGLTPTAITDYLQKGYIPRADKGLRLARALGVPLEWLIDDEAEWPPPESGERDVGKLTHEELMAEVGRRYWSDISFLWHKFRLAQKLKWAEEALLLYEELEGGGTSAEEARRQAAWPVTFEAAIEDLRHKYDPVDAAERAGYRLPDDPQGDDLSVERLADAFKEWSEQEPGLGYMQALFWILDAPADERAERARQQKTRELRELVGKQRERET